MPSVVELPPRQITVRIVLSDSPADETMDAIGICPWYSLLKLVSVTMSIVTPLTLTKLLFSVEPELSENSRKRGNMKLTIDEIVQGKTLEFNRKEDLLKALNQVIDDSVIEVKVLRAEPHCSEGSAQCN